MSDRCPERRRDVERSPKLATKRGYVALAFSALVSGTSVGVRIWLVQLYTSTSNLAGLFLLAVPVLVLVAIGVDIVAGWNGGRNRLLAAVGGLLLLAPAMYVLMGLMMPD